ncbi:MAG TPA: glycosyltransferase family 4 protein [Gaiellaceae bacterium]|nr:glycosyltransferase family 4 protein [Gaiellaceae bacterium]
MTADPHRDLAVLAQDPRFGGGSRSLVEAFCLAARELGRSPHVYYVSRAGGTSLLPPRVAVAPRPERHGSLEGTAVPSFLPELDAVNQLVSGERVSRTLRQARSLWLVAGGAPFGWGALRSGRPYACWLATGAASEWASRQALLPRSRRLALGMNKPVLRRVERSVLRGAAAVYGISPASRRTLAGAAGLPQADVGVLPVPVDLERYAPEPDELWRERLDRPLILFVGRSADPRKNLGLLLAAFPAVRACHPEARLRIVGEPPPPPVLAAAGPGVEIAGRVDDVAAELRSAALLVLPSLQEGFGIVAAEALACGVPVLTTPCGGPEELVRESDGGRVLVGFSPEELAEEAGTLLADRETLTTMRRRGREYVEREHSPARLRDLLDDAFRRLDEAGGPPTPC